MQDMSDDDRKQTGGVVLFDELHSIRESLDDVPKRTEFNLLKVAVAALSPDMQTVRAAVTNQRQDNWAI